jgi:hypothetical protein
MRMRNLAAIAAAATLSASAFSVVGHASSGGTGAVCGPVSGGGSNSINGALGGQNQVGNSLGLLDQLVVAALGNAAGGSGSSTSSGSGISGSSGISTSGDSGNSNCGGHVSKADRQAMGLNAATAATSSHHTSHKGSKHHSRG